MDKTIINILKKIEANEFEAFVVGGYVRDKILGIETRDVDICTNALPKDIKSIFKLEKISNDHYGNVNIKTKKYNIDITTFRKESNYKNHSPKNVEYINNVKDDLKRRDFKINSILMNSKGEIIDYYNGVNDINEKIIKCIGKTEDRFKEDPLRILRAIRFSIIYDFKLDEEIISFIKINKKLLNKVSFYRKKEELDKILCSKNKIKGLKLLKDLKLSKVLGVDYNEVVYSNDILGMYSQIDYSDKYPLTKNEKEVINKVRDILDAGKIDNYTLYKYGLYISSIAGEILGIEYKDINKKWKVLPIKTRKDIKISLESIVKLNNNCYNRVNEIYKELEINILNGNIKNRYKDIVRYIRK